MTPRMAAAKPAVAGTLPTEVRETGPFKDLGSASCRREQAGSLVLPQRFPIERWTLNACRAVLSRA